MDMCEFSFEGMTEGVSENMQSAGARCWRTCQVEGDICSPHLQGCGNGKQANERHAVAIQGIVARSCIENDAHDSP